MLNHCTVLHDFPCVAWRRTSVPHWLQTPSLVYKLFIAHFLSKRTKALSCSQTLHFLTWFFMCCLGVARLMAQAFSGELGILVCIVFLLIFEHLFVVWHSHLPCRHKRKGQALSSNPIISYWSISVVKCSLPREKDDNHIGNKQFNSIDRTKACLWPHRKTNESFKLRIAGINARKSMERDKARMEISSPHRVALEKHLHSITAILMPNLACLVWIHPPTEFVSISAFIDW